MAAKKKPKTAPVGNLTAAHLDKMSKQIAKIAESQSELVGIVKAFKLDVAVNFRELKDTLVGALATAIADSITQATQADRARMDAIEERLTRLERAS